MGFTSLLTAGFNEGLFGGGAVQAEVPGKYPSALDGHPYFLDTAPERGGDWTHQSISLIRQQADPSSFPNEATLNPESLWRRFQDSAHHGAGQQYLDRDNDADPYRFYTSKGIDVWTRYKLSLLPDTDQKRSSSNTNLAIATAGARVYVADGQSLRYATELTSDSPTFTAVTGTNASNITALTSDGFNVYAGFGNGIGKTDTGTGAITDAWNALTVSVLKYVKGRLMAVGSGSNAYKIYNVTASGAAPSALFTHPNTGFVFVDFTEGRSHIYCAGYSGDKSLIYRIAVKPDGTSLDQPIVALELPDGEIVRSIQGYLGYVAIGTDKGLRLCEQDGDGSLVMGARINTTSPVYCFEPQDQFIWFGYTNYDGTSTGLGRMDLTTFTSPLVPAYASDLMVTGQGTVLSVVTFGSLRFFAVSALGFYAQTSTKVASGSYRSGQIGYGVPDPKTSLFVNVLTEPLDGSVQVLISTDGSAFSSMGTNSTADTTSFQFTTSQSIGQFFEVELVLNRASDTTLGPVINRWTLKSFPTLGDGSAAEIRQIPFLFYHYWSEGQADLWMDVAEEINHIKELRSTRRVVVLQELSDTTTGFVDDFRWIPHHLTRDDQGNWRADGTMVVAFKRVE